MIESCVNDFATQFPLNDWLRYSLRNVWERRSCFVRYTAQPKRATVPEFLTPAGGKLMASTTPEISVKGHMTGPLTKFS